VRERELKQNIFEIRSKIRARQPPDVLDEDGPRAQFPLGAEHLWEEVPLVAGALVIAAE
jgi:hypothetical protein